MNRIPIVFVLWSLAGCASAPPPCPCPVAPPAAPQAAAAPAETGVVAAGPDLRALMRSIVQIKVKVSEQAEGGQLTRNYEYGTGFFIDHEGRILTSAHVIAAVEDPRDLVVLVQGRPLQARVLYKDRETDLAILGVDAGEVVPLEMKAGGVRLGQRVFAVGFPFVEIFRDGRPAVSVGHLAGLDREIDMDGARVANLLLTDAFVADGCSGGPLLDEEGKVLGVLRFNLANRGTWLGLSFAEPVASLPAKWGGPR